LDEAYQKPQITTTGSMGPAPKLPVLLDQSVESAHAIE
jgi:hypothetical protein